MGLFSRKKSSEESAPPTDAQGSNGTAPADKSSDGKSGRADFTPDPDKAQVWFKYAKTAAESTNYEYALTCYANGIKLDPDSHSAHQAMWEAAIQYRNRGGKPATSREIKQVDDSGNPVSRFAAAEFAWMKDIVNSSLALKAIEASGKAEVHEFGHEFAKHAFNFLRKEKKVSKSGWMQAMEIFRSVDAWDQALASGEAARALDPSDADLARLIQNISAQRAMDKGGYERAAQDKDGGFRAFVKDAEKQRELLESESIASGASIDQRNLERARLAYEKAPNVPENIASYAQLLNKENTAEAEEKAHQIYMKGFTDTGEYRFRAAAGDIRIKQSARTLEKLSQALEADPSNAATKSQLDDARAKHLDLEHTEFTGRVEKYPTDRFLKTRLGEIEFNRGHFEKAMGFFQESKDEPKLKVRAGLMLGRCFAASGWHAEAVAEFKEALETLGTLDKDLELDIRYDLLNSLMALARAEKSVDLAREALDICSGIARTRITYRDIRAKRNEVD
ncbi:MAG TPA: hypothetical protein VG711_06385, partial [Phycisphaerales bacterium]|nr:hypothetical protein [Phycisphaerales bacterium]